MNWINGKKLITGWALLTIAGGIAIFYQSAGIDMPPMVKGLAGLLEYLGMAIGAVGAAHKGLKGQLTAGTESVDEPFRT